MFIRDVLIRFYKSFNYDYELKAHPNAEKPDWQATSDGWLPHVRIPLESDISAIVGANESGKSHLLDAIQIVLTGKGLRERDFCRYSTLFSVEEGKRLFPEVGATFELTEEDQTALRAVNVPMRANNNLTILRPTPERLEVLDDASIRVELSESQQAAVNTLMPHGYQLNTQVDLPDAVSIAALANTTGLRADRRKRHALLTSLEAADSVEALTAAASGIIKILKGTVKEDQRQELGRLLLVKVAKIAPSSFAELQQAIAEEREGLVNGLIQEMNRSIARHLNISKWWTQDQDFELRISPREYELVFTIRDRTGTDYSFSERSRGLTFFLSYYVQLLSHDRPPGRPEVLLMDEPDAYLSATGQQDLLRVLENYVHPDDSDRQDQIVYVTHSPFLINRNAGHRVRVLDKGTRDEGTRLVRDATQNHYEPLRTSLGAAVAETAFIGGDNLFIEGIADQVLLSGINALLLRSGAPPSRCLDLNKVTLVPGGSNVPYMLYLARGRDRYKPACAVLLDSDKTGKQARAQIQKGGAKGKPTVSDDLIVMLGEWAEQSPDLAIADGVEVEETEDLLPVEIVVAAARRYASHFLGIPEAETAGLVEANISAALPENHASMWDALQSVFVANFQTEIAKAGFAKEVVNLLTELQQRKEPLPDDAAKLLLNFGLLLRTLAEVLQVAREREEEARRDHRLERIIGGFVDTYPAGAIRDNADVMLRRVEAVADNTPEGDILRAAVARVRRTYDLKTEPLSRVSDYATFLADLKAIPIQVRLGSKGRLDTGELEEPSSAASSEVHATSPGQTSAAQGGPVTTGTPPTSAPTANS